MKTPAQAAANYGTNGTAAPAVTAWAADFITAFPTMIANATKQVPFWQAQVSTPAAAAAMTAGLARANNNIAATTAKVNGPGKTSFMAGVLAASKGNYLAFANEFLPAVSTEVQTLDRTNPRGTFADNLSRFNAYITWLHGQKGNFKQ
jgi:hypothetical protein